MPSTFTWLDYSEHERRQFDEIIRAFAEKDTRDELGLGSVRDAFADMLFPGTSTIQTRARYFLFIPWIYREVERLRERPAAVSARKREIALIGYLARSPDTDGVIGIEAKESLKRLPSAIYWQGLGAWGIRLFPGTQEQYHGLLDIGGAGTRHDMVTDDGELLDTDLPRRWHGSMPPAPKGFPRDASLVLTSVEAQFLSERILSQCPGTMLAFLVDSGRPHDRLDLPWKHPQLGEMPPQIQEQLRHARNFSECMVGAAVLYNLMLAQKAEQAELVRLYVKGLREWTELIGPRRDELTQWNNTLEDFWRIATSQGALIPAPARRFIQEWLSLVLFPGNLAQISNLEPARQLIYERECALKRGLARLENPRALELWSGASGVYQHNYRWPSAQRIIRDIFAGLSQEDTDAGSR